MCLLAEINVKILNIYIKKSLVNIFITYLVPQGI